MARKGTRKPRARATGGRPQREGKRERPHPGPLHKRRAHESPPKARAHMVQQGPGKHSKHESPTKARAYTVPY